MPYTHHPIPTRDGLNLFLRDYPPTGAVTGLPVLCLHGLTRNSADFEGIAPGIAALGRRVLVLDVRGRGWSDRDPDPTRYRPDIYALDVLDTLDALGIARAVLIGTSMGGLITMLVAVQAPARVAAAVLNDVGPELNPVGLARIAGYVGKSEPVRSWPEMAALVKASNGVAFPDADESFWQTMARRVSQQLPDGSIALAYDPAIAKAFARPQPVPPPSLIPLFEALAKVPVLVIRGALSDVLSEEGVAVMRTLKPDLETAEVPRVGHAPTLEETEARNALAAFLVRVP
jgi:pimeloyl-ACP methyl ester carboxylesterase